jgi:hypothetical protein
MTIGSRRLCAHTAIAAAAVVLLASGAGVAAETKPRLRMIATTDSVTIARWGPVPAWLDTGTYIVAESRPFEVRVTRASYNDPVVATQIIRGKRATGSIPMPAGLVRDFTGFHSFLHVRIRDASGAVVIDKDLDFCPNAGSGRSRPDAPDRSPYPRGCPTNPFALGAVWGIQEGWAASTAQPVDVAVGVHTVSISINERYRRLFGIPVRHASATVRVEVVEGEPEPMADGPALGSGDRSSEGHAGHPMAGFTPAQSTVRTRRQGSVPAPHLPRPDLRSLPAWGLSLDTSDGRDEVSFNATVWTAGRSPLFVEGFRRAGTDVMDAYQYLYGSDGRPAGHFPAGTMEWDAREGHEHWHFTDFAGYRLLDASRRHVVASAKESFCLASTDAIDYTIPHANRRPDNVDLRSSCGDRAALSVRQVLDVGSGDTYHQYLPGQAFDVTNLPNGVYYIEIMANPDRRLYETDTTNNVSLREFVLGGVPGERTLRAPPYGRVRG